MIAENQKPIWSSPANALASRKPLSESGSNHVQRKDEKAEKPHP